METADEKSCFVALVLCFSNYELASALLDGFVTKRPSSSNRHLEGKAARNEAILQLLVCSLFLPDIIITCMHEYMYIGCSR